MTSTEATTSPTVNTETTTSLTVKAETTTSQIVKAETTTFPPVTTETTTVLPAETESNSTNTETAPPKDQTSATNSNKNSPIDPADSLATTGDVPKNEASATFLIRDPKEADEPVKSESSLNDGAQELAKDLTPSDGESGSQDLITPMEPKEIGVENSQKETDFDGDTAANLNEKESEHADENQPTETESNPSIDDDNSFKPEFNLTDVPSATKQTVIVTDDLNQNSSGSESELGNIESQEKPGSDSNTVDVDKNSNNEEIKPTVKTPEPYYPKMNDLVDEDSSKFVAETRHEELTNPEKQVPTVAPGLNSNSLANKLKHKQSQQSNSQEVKDAQEASQPVSAEPEAKATNASSFPSKYCAELEPIKHLLNDQIGNYYIPLIGNTYFILFYFFYFNKPNRYVSHHQYL